MIIIHRGKGGLILVAGVLSALFMNLLTAKLFGYEYYAEHIWPKFGTFALLASICLVGGLYLRAHPTIPKSLDKPIEGESFDHLFYIPVIYWSPIFLLLGVAYVVYKLTGPGR